MRSNDGSDDVVPYVVDPAPGIWQPTAPAFAPPALPQWGYVTPFAMSSGDQFRPDGQTRLNARKYVAEFKLTKRIGEIDSTFRTDEQTTIAFFWADGAGTVTPPGHWNQIARDVATAAGNTLAKNARLLALLVTPPFPEYVSGQSTFSSAAAAVLAAFFGSNHHRFTTQSDGAPGVTRRFKKFSRAAAEAGISRIYGGIHFQSANLEGQATGKAIGEYVAANYLSPLL